MLKTAHFALALSLLLALTPALDAVAGPGASFSHGFSSHAASSHASPHASSSSHAASAAPKSGFGSFSRQAQATRPSSTDTGSAGASSMPRGGFGSFGQGQAAPQRSDSALSQQLSRQAAQAKALQTLDERNAARAAQNAPQPVPGYASPSGAPMPPAGMSAPAPAAPTTVIVHQDGGGLGHVIAGAMIARSVNAHAQGGYYPAPGYNGGGYNGTGGGYNGTGSGAGNGGGAHGGTSFFSLFVTLCLLAVIAWGLWFAWRGLRRRRAAIEAANKPNYSFERN